MSGAVFCLDARGADFVPDPLSVQSFGNGYRYPQEGWTVVHIEGAPYERGLQHGRLLAPEIAAYIRCLAASYGYKAPAESWSVLRQLTGVLMMRHYTGELLEEMQGIADGASAAGARVDGRRLDVTDIATINASNELDLLEEALKATPTGTEGIRLPEASGGSKGRDSRPMKRPHPTRCSAFAANGAATADGKIVFGHITMYDLYPAAFYNVWIDVKPVEGFRFMMQTTPGGVHSGMDYIINEAGLILSETTVQQTACDPAGSPLCVRIRKASQYADSIEKAAEILSGGGNGLCSTEWILADVRRNEIALLTLGLKEHKLHRSSQNEWIGGTEGFYWSCNNTKDAEVRLETTAGMRGRPSAAAVFEPTKRDALWVQLYQKNKGHIDGAFAREVLTTPALVSAFSVDAVYTTADMALGFKSWGSFGPPAGGIRNPSFTERTRFPEIRSLASNPWTLIQSGLRPEPLRKSVLAVDLHDPENPAHKTLPRPQHREADPETPKAWNGTLLPAGAPDLWLPVSFAHFEKIVALENEFKRKGTSAILTPDHLEELGVELNYYRSVYALGMLAGGDAPLSDLKEDVSNENWHRIASGKGVLFLHSLRGLIGADAFDRAMDRFGLEQAGHRVSTEIFLSFLEKETGRKLQSFFHGWLREPGLARVRLLGGVPRQNGRGWLTSVKVSREKEGGAPLLPLTVETEDEEETTVSLVLEKLQETVEISTAGRPVRVLLDKYGAASCANPRTPFTILTFDTELEHTLIVYGTTNEKVANAEAARLLQQALRRREHNTSVPIRSDSEVNEGELQNNHIILIGRPACNTLGARWEKSLPVAFGKGSFEVRDEHYAHPNSAVVCAAGNPLNGRYSVVCVAGLSSHGTLSVVPSFEEESLPYAQVVVLPNEKEPQALTLPSPEMIKTLR